jgi:hypothetical protein
MRSVVALVVCCLGALSSCDCGGDVLPTPPAQCDVVSGVGCLSDEVCVDGTCQPLGRCEDDGDCPSVAWRCVFPAQFCELRAGFGEECSADIPCAAGSFCALGSCRVIDETAQPCATRLDCRAGFMCDKVHSLCIEEAPCTFADQGFPETACDDTETCQADGVCATACQGLCTPDTEEADCGSGQRCGAACTCVQCLSNDDCGVGLVCNTRNGRCQSEGLCFTNDDCTAPLECGTSGLCEVPPPPCTDDFDCTVAEICNLETTRCELPDGECFDDRFENADTPAAAEAFDLVVDAPKLIDGLVLCPDDDDVYEFSLAAGDRLTIQASNTVPTARATLWLLDSNGETSVGFAETPPRGNGEIVYTAQVDEVIYLRVNALLAQTPYELTATLTRAAACVADFFEGAAGNNSIDVATPTTLSLIGVPMSAEICRGDVDIFTVDLAAGEGVLASVAFDTAKADLDLAILDEAGEVLVSSSGVEQPEVVQRRLIDGGRVFVRVRGFANTAAPYTLNLTRLAPVGCVDDVEVVSSDDDAPRAVVVPNVDAVGGAAPLTERRGVCAGGALADVDRYTVDVEDFERLVVTAVPVEPGLVLQVQILDAAGAVLRTSATGDNAATVSMSARATETFTVAISSPLGQIGAYDAILSKKNQGQCSVDAGEPNNTLITRSALPAPSDVVTICSSDEDFYVLSGVAGKKVTIDVRFRQGDGDIDVQLIGLDGRQILATSDSQSDNERIEQVLPLDGEYTIRVFSLSSGEAADYLIDAVLSSP